ncbi:hypothetical protein SAY87_016813 [Trapa incisa]|uniref:Pectinesterase n=1 Tax=Trapa incisa TaxID=236973 RepID=A0AAN7QVM8_9MYRT|nr:hypothetical protein SAY87_016813 [Trapa incisa]
MSPLNRRNLLLFSSLFLPTLAIFLLLSSTFDLLAGPLHYTAQPRAGDFHVHRRQQLQEETARSHCEGTLYPELCVSTVSVFPDLALKSLPQIIAATIKLTSKDVVVAAAKCSGIKQSWLRRLGPLEQHALDDCRELFQHTVDEFRIALPDLNGTSSASKHIDDLQTLLSGAMTNQFTCLDGFAYSNSSVRNKIEEGLVRISRHVSNSLSMLKKVPGNKTRSTAAAPKVYGSLHGGFPSWVSGKERRLLQASTNETKFDLIVAKDGTGNFTNITDALAAAPNSSTTRFVIYIKAGAYFENVEVISKQKNLMFVGDGIEKTWIKGNRSVVDGWTTFRSATIAVVGNGFIAKGISFENYAGPEKHQAVALRSGSDLSVFYQCRFIGYQDTLYVHSLRQFYRECDIYGTVDFIFGNAATVLQNCNLYARRPLDNQQNIFTAQGRDDPNQNTGISILGCKVAAASDLIPVQSSFRTYLGRPWKQYSRTVFMNSYIEDLVDPAGWLEWNGTVGLSTLYYGEYMNAGPGSNTSARVTWPGYRVINSSAEASQFTVGEFIQGNDWLNGTGVPYYAGLS